MDVKDEKEVKSELKKIKDQIYRKEYYLKHKDKWIGREICHTCGSSFVKSNKKRHLNTKKHLFRINKKWDDIDKQLNLENIVDKELNLENIVDKKGIKII